MSFNFNSKKMKKKQKISSCHILNSLYFIYRCTHTYTHMIKYNMPRLFLFCNVSSNAKVKCDCHFYFSLYFPISQYWPTPVLCAEEKAVTWKIIWASKILFLGDTDIFFSFTLRRRAVSSYASLKVWSYFLHDLMTFRCVLHNGFLQCIGVCTHGLVTGASL